MTLAPITPEEVMGAIRELNAHKVATDVWRQGQFVPVRKKTAAAADLPTSYRPITLLRNEFKLFAK
eukprot:4084560-Amphidinium_carterae.2